MHASALALSPDGRYLVVANAGSDTLSVIDTRTDKIVETHLRPAEPGDLFGAQPNALAFDKNGQQLFVCNGTQNAVAVFSFKAASRLIGLFPIHRFEPGKSDAGADPRRLVPGRDCLRRNPQGHLRREHQGHRAEGRRANPNWKPEFNSHQYMARYRWCRCPRAELTG